MKRILLFLCVVILGIISGCTASNEGDIKCTLKGVNESYYNEGIRILNTYCNEEFINERYYYLRNNSLEVMVADAQKLLGNINTVRKEFVNRAVTDEEKIYANKISGAIRNAITIPVFMIHNEQTGVGSTYINEFWDKLSAIKAADKIEQIQVLDFGEYERLDT